MKKYLWMMMAVMGMISFVACGGDDKDDNEETQDPRIMQVVPSKYLNDIKNHMTIYEGENPPNVEGVFCMGPSIGLVYDSYYGWDKDPDFGQNFIEFSNQDENSRTLYFREGSDSGNFIGSGSGAYISGEGNNFTVFLNTKNTETDDDGTVIKYTKATIISGTKSSGGIRNLRYAFVITEKTGDPDDTRVMKVGVFRIVNDKDEFSEGTTWVNTRSDSASRDIPCWITSSID